MTNLTNNSDVPALQRAEAILARGCSIIPLLPGKKDPDTSLVPKIDGKPGTGGAAQRTREIDKAREWAIASPNANIGLCADEQFTILETDDEDRLRRIVK